MNSTKPTSNLKLQIIILSIGLVIMAAKFVAYFLTHSNTILTDALESIVNIAAGAMGVYSLYLAAKPKDSDHPYGHGKIEFISASVEGTLISATGLMMLIKSTVNFFEPSEVSNLDIGLYITTIAGLFNYLLGWRLESQGKKNNSLTLVASGKHLKSDAYTTVGILVGLLIIYFTGYLLLDNVIAMVLGVYIMYTGFTILRQSVAGIMDEADSDLLVNVIKILTENRRQQWVDVHNMRIIKYGSSLHIDCHVTLPWYLTIKEAHVETEAIDQLINQHYPQGVEFFIHTDACIEQSCKVCTMSDCKVRLHPLEEPLVWNLANVMQNQKHGL
jgi:cation diffusion facilitator family transporter